MKKKKVNINIEKNKLISPMFSTNILKYFKIFVENIGDI